MSAAKEAALLCRKAGSATTLLTVRLPCSGTRLAEKKRSTSGTVVTLAVCDGVGVCVGVAVWVGVKLEVGVALRLGVVVGVALRLGVDEKLVVGELVAVCDGVGDTDGDGVGDGDAEGSVHVAAEPEPAKVHPLGQMHEEPAPATKPGEHAQLEAEPTEVEPTGQAVQVRAVVTTAELLKKLVRQPHGRPAKGWVERCVR